MTPEPEKVELSTPDLAAKNLEALQTILPGVVADGVLDVARLAELINVEIAGVKDGRERYGLMWAGKRDAVQSLLSPSAGTLVPDLKRSADFDSAENVFVEGDNLEVLKLLQKAYNDQVKLIYIDPPYNTGTDFVYNDDFADGLAGYLEYTGQLNSDGNRAAANTDVAGRRHSRWLSMMYPRLVLGRNLLTPDGVIMIHIDEHEAPRLQLVLEEVFGPENNLGEIVWDKRNPKGDAGGISSQHETILVFARSRETLLAGPGLQRHKNAAEEIVAMASRIWATVGQKQVPEDLQIALKRHRIPLEALRGHEVEVTVDEARQQFARWLRAQPFSGGELAYDKIDDDGEVYRLVSMAWPNKKKAPADYWIPLIHPITGKPCPVPARGWRNPPATMATLLAENRIVFGADETTQPQRKYLLRENMTTSVASIVPYGGSDDRLLEELGIPFDTAKPVELVRQLVASVTSGDDLVLDFFAGSGTTAHAVNLQNEADGGRRRCISVNLPESVSPASAAASAGFETVAEITLSRLRAVLTRSDVAANQGLRSFTLSESQFRSSRADHVQGDLLELTSATLRPGLWNADAIAQEILIKEGVRLDATWNRSTIEGAEVVSAEGIVVVLSTDVSEKVASAAADTGPRVLVFLEDGFDGRDAVKANVFFQCRQAGITMKTV